MYLETWLEGALSVEWCMELGGALSNGISSAILSKTFMAGAKAGLYGGVAFGGGVGVLRGFAKWHFMPHKIETACHLLVEAGLALGINDIGSLVGEYMAGNLDENATETLGLKFLFNTLLAIVVAGGSFGISKIPGVSSAVDKVRTFFSIQVEVPTSTSFPSSLAMLNRLRQK